MSKNLSYKTVWDYFKNLLSLISSRTKRYENVLENIINEGASLLRGRH